MSQFFAIWHLGAMKSVTFGCIAERNTTMCHIAICWVPGDFCIVSHDFENAFYCNSIAIAFACVKYCIIAASDDSLVTYRA